MMEMRNVWIIAIAVALTASLVYCQSMHSAKGILSADATGKDLLEIRTPNNLGCDIELVAFAQNKVEVKYEKLAKTGSLNTDQRYIELIDIGLDESAQNSSALRLRVLTPTKAPWEGKDSSARVVMRITVPANFKIDSKNSYSDLKLIGPLSGIWINNEYGAINIENVNGETVVKTSYSNVDISRIKGDIDIQTSYSGILARDIVIGENPGLFETSYGSIVLSNIKGSIEASTSNELIDARDIQATDGSVILRNSYGKIKADSITGELVCETSYNPIELSNIVFSHGLSNIETSYSPIRLSLAKIVDAQLAINNTYNNINMTLLKDISARVTLAVDKGGKIHTRGFAIKPLVMEKTRLEGLVGDGRSKMELNINGIGEIFLEGR